jgi:ubiquinone/menaquinone biosynthesis C-methylase UbiE
MIDKKTFVHGFWDNLANQNYREALVGWYNDHNADPNEEKLLFRDMSFDPNESVALDFGCGPGRCIIKFRHRFKRIDGADISSVILERLQGDLVEARVPIPNLYHIDGHSLKGVPDATYDVVYSIICMQHIANRDWRLELYREFMRVLKPGGWFTFQMGYGSGHNISREYEHVYSENETSHYDVRVEDETKLVRDLIDQGFTNVDFVITDPCHDQHPQWIWAKCQKT